MSISKNEGRWCRFTLNEEVDSDFPEDIKHPGNYAIIINEKCIYVGQSGNLKKRLKTHIQLARYSNHWKTTWGNFLRVTIAIRREKYRFERMTIEARLIFRLKPQYNQLLTQQIRKINK